VEVGRQFHGFGIRTEAARQNGRIFCNHGEMLVKEGRAEDVFVTMALRGAY
jgi:hypothetical protein